MWMQTLIGIFLIMHGLVHWVYAAPQDKTAEAKPFNVLTERWLVKKAGLNAMTALKLGVILMILASAGFIFSGIVLLISQSWWAIPATATAGVSLAFLALFWDKMMVVGAAIKSC